MFIYAPECLVANGTEKVKQMCADPLGSWKGSGGHSVAGARGDGWACAPGCEAATHGGLWRKLATGIDRRSDGARVRRCRGLALCRMGAGRREARPISDA